VGSTLPVAEMTEMVVEIQAQTACEWQVFIDNGGCDGFRSGGWCRICTG
jgi:hypothetical protein